MSPSCLCFRKVLGADVLCLHELSSRFYDDSCRGDGGDTPDGGGPRRGSRRGSRRKGGSKAGSEGYPGSLTSVFEEESHTYVGPSSPPTDVGHRGTGVLLPIPGKGFDPGYSRTPTSS